jgi:hypothetical protein
MLEAKRPHVAVSRARRLRAHLGHRLGAPDFLKADNRVFAVVVSPPMTLALSSGTGSIFRKGQPRRIAPAVVSSRKGGIATAPSLKTRAPTSFPS